MPHFDACLTGLNHADVAFLADLTKNLVQELYLYAPNSSLFVMLAVDKRESNPTRV